MNESKDLASTESITVVRKHPLAIRWNHWVNFPLVAIMAVSGLAIAWANPVHIVSGEMLGALGLNYKLGMGLAWHVNFAFAFALNGILYFAALLATGHWRFVSPKPSDFVGAALVVAHDLRLRQGAPVVDGKYNPAQKIAYFAVFVLGAILMTTGLAIFKPTQLQWLLRLCGGYEVARAIHFYSTLLLAAFFVVHVAQVMRAGWNAFRAMITGVERVEK